jgi:hypothetical protein
VTPRFDPTDAGLIDIVKCVIHATIAVTTDCHHFGRVTADGTLTAAWAIWCFRQIIRSAHQLL